VEFGIKHYVQLGGLKEHFLDDFAARFQAEGFAALVFDNRNWEPAGATLDMSLIPGARLKITMMPSVLSPLLGLKSTLPASLYGAAAILAAMS
jgi:hypothetical protein